MSHRDEKDRYVRKIVKNGAQSYYINIPKEIVDELHLRERQKLTVTRNGKHIVLKDWKR